MLDEGAVYDRIGEAGFSRLVGSFYRQVPDDPVLGRMYPKDDLAGAEARLRDFLVGRFGGPARYVEQRGNGHTVLLFARENNSRNGLACPYSFLGPADYVSHTGSRPMSIYWDLEHAMPAWFFEICASLRAA